MTISYTGDICSSRSWSFLKVIFRWKGSIWKSVILELIVWLFLYYTVMLINKFLLNNEQRRLFQMIAQYTNNTVDYIPLTFMLGFFVKIVVDRWKGSDIETLEIRRNIMRYLCLTQVLILRDISVKVRKRFPNLEAVVSRGLLSNNEKASLDNVSKRFDSYWLPINWICQLCYRMREKQHIESDPVLTFLLKEILTYRERLQTLCNYDWVPVPLAYPQVVFVAVRTYFMICLISRQNQPRLDRTDEFSESTTYAAIIELVFPIMTVLQVKVAEALLNPLGEDDDDFETLFVIDRNYYIAMQLADECKIPEPDRVESPILDHKFGEETFGSLIGSAASIHQNKVKATKPLPVKRRFWSRQRLSSMKNLLPFNRNEKCSSLVEAKYCEVPSTAVAAVRNNHRRKQQSWVDNMNNAEVLLMTE